MPEMDGYEAALKIRAMEDPYFKQVPIIALTASAMSEIRDQSLAAGMTDFLSKPFQPDELQQIIEQYVLTKKHLETPVVALNSDLYSNGDAEFKRELEVVLIRNIHELQELLRKSIILNDGEIFIKAVNKAKASIGMLGDKEFDKMIENISTLLSDMTNRREELVLYTNRFEAISKRIVSGLEENVQTI